MLCASCGKIMMPGRDDVAILVDVQTGEHRVICIGCAPPKMLIHAMIRANWRWN